MRDTAVDFTPTTRPRRHVSLDPETNEVLERSGNASGYLTRIIPAHWRAWQDGRAALRAAGWRDSELVAVCDALVGVAIRLTDPVSPQLRLELANARPFHAARIRGERWKALVATVTARATVAEALKSEALARALVLQVRECEASNAEWAYRVAWLGDGGDVGAGPD